MVSLMDGIQTVFGDPFLFGFFLLGCLIMFMVFGRLSIVVGAPIMTAGLFMSFEFMPDLKIVFGIIYGIIIGIALLRLYRG